MHKIDFTPVALSKGVVFSYALLIFVYCYFFHIPVFHENHLIASNNFLIDVLGITQGHLTKEAYLQHLPLSGRCNSLKICKLFKFLPKPKTSCRIPLRQVL